MLTLSEAILVFRGAPSIFVQTQTDACPDRSTTALVLSGVIVASSMLSTTTLRPL